MSQRQDNLGTRIAKLRKGLGLTQEALAKELRMTREKYNMWEQNARQLKATDIEQLARYFKVSSDYLLIGVNSEQSDIFHATGLSQAAIDALRQFKAYDHFVGDETKSGGRCEALSKALSNSALLGILATLMNTPKGEPGYFESSWPSDDGKFYHAMLSPDSYLAILYQRLQLTVQAIRTGDNSMFNSYAPFVRMGEAFDSDPANYSFLHRMKQAKNQLLKEMNALDKIIEESATKGEDAK